MKWFTKTIQPLIIALTWWFSLSLSLSLCLSHTYTHKYTFLLVLTHRCQMYSLTHSLALSYDTCTLQSYTVSVRIYVSAIFPPIDFFLHNPFLQNRQPCSMASRAQSRKSHLLNISVPPMSGVYTCLLSRLCVGVCVCVCVCLEWFWQLGVVTH